MIARVAHRGFAEPDPGENFCGVRLDLHPAAATVALLSPRQVAVDGFQLELNPRRQAFDDSDETLAMRLPGREITQLWHPYSFIKSRMYQSTNSRP